MFRFERQRLRGLLKSKFSGGITAGLSLSRFASSASLVALYSGCPVWAIKRSSTVEKIV